MLAGKGRAASLSRHNIPGLHKHRDRYYLPVDELIEGVGIVDQNQTVIYANPALCRMLEYTKEALVGQTAANLVEDGDRTRYLDQFAARKRGTGDLCKIAWKGKRGRKVHTLLSVQPILRGDGRVRGGIALLLDTTERENTLRSYRALAEDLPGAVYRFSLAEGASVPFLDDSISRMTGYPPEEIPGSEVHPIYSLVVAHHRKRLKDAIGAALASLSPFRVEYHVRRRDGQVRHFLDCGRPLAVGEQQIGGVILDITERKRLEEELRRSRLELNHLSDQLSVVEEVERTAISRELHDGLGQDLVAAQMRLGVLLRRNAVEDADLWATGLSDLVTILNQATEDLRCILAGSRPSILDSFGLLPTLAWLCREFRAIAPDLDLRLDIRLDPNDIPQIIATSAYRIVQESLSNVVKHARASHVVVSLARCGETIVLKISDTGSGFDPDAASLPGPTAESDHGFGLWNIRERVVLSGGTLTIRSAAGSGTAIRVEWPSNR